MPKQDKPKTRKRGRPPKGDYPNTTARLSCRITQELRDSLDSARKGKRSLAQETEMRLRQSFDHDLLVEGTFGGRKNYALLRLFRMAMETVEGITGQSWHEDAYTHEQCKRAVVAVLKEFRPKGRAEPTSPWPFEDGSPNNLGKEAGFGAAQQVVSIDDKPTIGMGSGAIFVSTNIRRDLGHLAERLDKAIVGRSDPIVVSNEFFSGWGKR